jgi:hypothetical protein
MGRGSINDGLRSDVIVRRLAATADGFTARPVSDSYLDANLPALHPQFS